MPAAPRPPRRPNFRGTSAADIDRYISGLVPARLPELERMEEIAWTEHFPIIGPAAGNFCYLVARMIAGDRDWVASIIPIRDGLLVARRH
jgi:predicted O-methyltransferase YrrM